MKVSGVGQVEVICDVCCQSTRSDDAEGHYGVLQGEWGNGALHSGERYELDLCEQCFFQAIANLKSARRVETIFDERNVDPCPANFGLIENGVIQRNRGLKKDLQTLPSASEPSSLESSVAVANKFYVMVVEHISGYQ